MQTITTPGKFEGCQEYALYFHDHVMNGFSDETYTDANGTVYDVFWIEPNEKEMFDLSDIDYAAIYYTDDNGFVYCNMVTKQELYTFIENIESKFWNDRAYGDA